MLKESHCSQLNYARLVMSTLHGVCFPCRCLTVGSDHDIVAAQCIGNHVVVFIGEDLLRLGFGPVDFVEGVDLFTGFVGKLSIVSHLPVESFASLQVVVGRI